MAELVAGPELDLAVAEACGIDGWIESLRNEATGYESPGRFVRSGADGFWEPSTDLNAAFAAADKAQLFGDSGVLRRAIDSNDWVYHSTLHYVYCRAKTPALAICAAILKLKGESDG